MLRLRIGKGNSEKSFEGHQTPEDEIKTQGLGVIILCKGLHGINNDHTFGHNKYRRNLWSE
jgi:hypothetical protein